MSSESPPFPLHKTMGFLFIGVIIANSLHGISIVQTFYYYRHQNDKWYINLLVAAVIVFDTVHQALITHTVYMYIISYWGDVEYLDYVVPSLKIQNFFNAFIALLVQSFLTARVWKLSDGNIWVTSFVALLVLAGFVSVTVFTILELQYSGTYIELVALKPLSLVVNILTAVADVVIAALLCFLLHRLRSGFQRSDTMINKLMLFALNTGLLTSLCALASFVSYLTAPNTFLYIMFYFCIGRLYTNSLLATLNVRKAIGGGSIMPMSTLEGPKSGSAFQFSCGTNNIPIQIDTTTESDRIHDQDRDSGKIEYLQSTSSNVAVGFDEKSVSV